MRGFFWCAQVVWAGLFLQSPVLVPLQLGSVCHEVLSRRPLEKRAAEESTRQLEGSNICIYFFAACQGRARSPFAEGRLL